MTILKQPSGKFRAVLKVGRVYAASRTFATKRDALRALKLVAYS